MKMFGHIEFLLTTPVQEEFISSKLKCRHACNLINSSTKQFVISLETDEIRVVEDRGDQVELARFMKDTVKNELRRCYEEVQELLHSASGPKLALLIDRKVLMGEVLSMDQILVETDKEVTSWVRKGPWRITLSIGDGANDVSMIQDAQVSVGRQCTKICKVYLHLVFCVQTSTVCTVDSLVKGYYDDLFQSPYNVIYTALSIIILGLFEKRCYGDCDSMITAPELLELNIVFKNEQQIIVN
ncbi:hypothetical protein CQW23_32788 [Capsicum baccatum]|uniref:Uncharacterized protein n=1 Tax=Capsicum baccatum TaxID=33114 RepID=A0A2G2V3S5_CAPBA|nr:hypothetical protein CQW23_32788 [Capsicum baccatum]